MRRSVQGLMGVLAVPAAFACGDSTAPNQAPTASISSPGSGSTTFAGEPVTFQGTATDPESGTLSGSALTWQSSLDGTLGVGSSLTTSDLSTGAHSIKLIAVDPAGGSDSAQVSIEIVVNQLPAATVTSPAESATFDEGQEITFTGSATDAEDGALPGASLTWISSIDGQFGSGETVTTTGLTAGGHVITLAAQDAQSQTGSATVSIDISPYPPDALEGDDSSPDATPISVGAIQSHNISPVTDEDWITFSLAAPSVVVLETRGEEDDDTFLELYDEALGLIESDNNDGVGANSRITRICGTNELPAGTYYARVTHTGGTSSIAAYELAYTAVSCVDFEDATPGYDIEVRYIGTPPALSRQQTFEDAAARWAELVVGDISDVIVLEPFSWLSCFGVELGPMADQIDDLLIFAQVIPIDGPGGILGSAGPCFIRSGTRHPLVGLMSFDADDVTSLENSGKFDVVVLHEMGHVIGFGTIWSFLGLLSDPTNPDPATINDTHFSGANAIAAFDAIGGAAYPDAKVPVENDNQTYGLGSLNGHWREAVFDNELMSPALDSPVDPISEVTVESLGDMGYDVDPGAADPYSLFWNSSLVAEGQGAKLQFGDDILRGPRLFTDGDGGLRPLGGAPDPVDGDGQ